MKMMMKTAGTSGLLCHNNNNQNATMAHSLIPSHDISLFSQCKQAARQPGTWLILSSSPHPTITITIGYLLVIMHVALLNLPIYYKSFITLSC